MTMNTERRNFIAGVGVAAASTAVLASTQAFAQGGNQTAGKALPGGAAMLSRFRPPCPTCLMLRPDVC
jgi:hypothetical protein